MMPNCLARNHARNSAHYRSDRRAFSMIGRSAD